LLHDFTVTDNIVKATLYRLRYRSRNEIGWSDYSPIAYVRAANVPIPPLKPSYNISTTDTVTLNIPRSLDDGGSPILGYRLWADAGNDFSSQFTEVPSYNTHDTLFTSIPTDLTPGATYRFKTTAYNVYGDSDFSYEIIVGVGANVPEPDQVTRDLLFESQTSMLVHWLPVLSSELLLTGYSLEMDDGLIGPFVEIYDGRDNT
jgi:hypothetical protein